MQQGRNRLRKSLIFIAKEGPVRGGLSYPFTTAWSSNYGGWKPWGHRLELTWFGAFHTAWYPKVLSLFEHGQSLVKSSSTLERA